MILEEGDYITSEHLPKEIIDNIDNDQGNGKLSIKIPPMGLVLEDIEIQILKQALDSTDGNQVRTAKLLGISRDTLRYRMKKFGFLKSGEN
jgi:DNA-binding NtrC family response regulator